jgi:hypothetical protein
MQQITSRHIDILIRLISVAKHTNRHCFQKECECNTLKSDRIKTYMLTHKSILKHIKLPEFATQADTDNTLNNLCNLGLLSPYFLHKKPHCYNFTDRLYSIFGLSIPARIKPPISNVIYFLYDAQELVYIGQSNKPAERIKSHIRAGEKKFDLYAYIPLKNFSRCERTMLESAYINTYRPKYNKAFVHHDVTVASYNGLPCPLQIQKHYVTLMTGGIYDL